MERGKKYLILLFCFAFIYKGYTQQSEFGIELGAQWYQMNDLQEFNKQLIGLLPFDAEIVDNYTAYYNYGVFTGFSIDSVFNIGLRYKFHSTGSRISRKDYSGEYRFDTRIRSHSPSLFMSGTVFRRNKTFSVNIITDIGFRITKLDIEEYFTIYDFQEKSDNYSYSSFGYFIDPGLELKQNLDVMVLGIRTGYQFDFLSENLDDDSHKLLKDLDGYVLSSDWSGFYVNFSVAINLNSLFDK